MNETVGLLLKALASFIVLVIFISVFTLGMGYIQAVGMKSYVNDQINREGGLTTQAVSNIETYNNEMYGGRFEVVSYSGNDSKPFGETVSYQINGVVDGIGFNITNALIQITGSSTSKVR